VLARFAGFRGMQKHAKRPDIDKQEFKLVPLDLQTFIDFYVFFY